MVAIELFRAVTIWNDMGWGNFSLHFIKNKEQQEVDFLIAADHEPIVLIEAKLSKSDIDKAWYFTQLRHPYLRMELRSDEELPFKLRFQEKLPSSSIPDAQFQSEIGSLSEESWKDGLQDLTHGENGRTRWVDDCRELFHTE